MKKFKEYKGLDLSKIAKDVQDFWTQNKIFEKSIESREGADTFVFYEGPPSANGMPGIHHVMARAIKDIFCRYKTQKGYQVKRKAGWDTHGLPVELSVEKALGITKEDIGKKISIAEYNQKCREAVMKYTDHWNKLTEKAGYWVDMNDPYITYDNKYIESVWWLLSQLYKKDLLYKGYTIQPYSPAAGTGLSSHELNQPGCYKDVKDTTVVAQFLLNETDQKQQLFGSDSVHMLAWTTTPWTLPSNTALTVGPKIEYVLVQTYNQYTHKPIKVVLAKNLIAKHFKAENAELELDAYNKGDKNIPYKIISEVKGTDLVGLTYQQLIDVATPAENPEKAFQVIPGDFVTTEDGTGIVHTAPTFGADDAMVAKKAGVPGMLVRDAEGKLIPIVDTQGKFIDGVDWLSGKFVKNEYYSDGSAPNKSTDVEIAIHLKEQNKAFKVEKYSHNYPHCWRTDKPVLYYPLDSWFVKTTEVKEKLIEKNKTINWKPASTGTGRFGNWLENLQDWNLSRSRYWGIPIPIWTSEDKKEQICIGSLKELYEACEHSVSVGVMKANPLKDFTPEDFSKENYAKIDLHRPYVDDIVLASKAGVPMYRELDLIDVWFDSGSMPYAQLHYPFENKELIDSGKAYPADFIAEGVDQTRGWFFTLHAIATMCFDSVAYKAVVSNGLVLDKNGQKMSKRLGNAVDPFETIEKYGPDATRFYMISNAQPWDNLKFDLEGIVEVQRKFFRAFHNTYAFFALYANVDGFNASAEEIAIAQRPEIDRWVLSRLNSLCAQVDAFYNDYEPTKAARAIQDFVVNELSNWYVRLCRKRFWRGDYSEDKIAAYQTLYTCLETTCKLVAPIAPFFAEQVFKDLTQVMGAKEISVHIEHFPTSNTKIIDQDLEQRMHIAQNVCSMVLSIRKKEKIKVRQPLQKIMVPALNDTVKGQIKAVEALILSEVNVKELEILEANSNVFSKTAKANFKALGPKHGKDMKAIAAEVQQFTNEQISVLETSGSFILQLSDKQIELTSEDVVIETSDIEGWQVMSENGMTVALDLSLNQVLIDEGIARELVNRIQNLRKEKGFEVTDRIKVQILQETQIAQALKANQSYVCAETLTDQLDLVASISDEATELDLTEDLITKIQIAKN